MSKSDGLSPKSRELLDDINLEDTIYVITRTGQKEILNTDRIVKRLQMLTRRVPKINHINPHELMLIVAQGLKSGITTYEIDEYAGNAAASLSVSNPHYMKLAARIIIDNHQKLTDRSFVDKMRKVYLRLDANGIVSPMVSSEFFKYVEKHQDIIEPMIDYSRDFLFDFFGFRTFQAMYGFIINGRSVERPQDLFMRTAIALHMNTCDRTEEGLQLEIARIRETYTALSLRTYTQASPTYFNAGATQPQYSSCFLLGTEDSRKGIMHTADSASEISKLGGGIGIHIHNWRSKGTFIRGTNGYSNGIVPFLKIYNSTMIAFNQGGRRPGSAAIYLMPHHPDIEAFLKLRLPTGIESERARELFYAVWIPNIFMERVRDGDKWSLFDPDYCGDLSDYYDSKQEKSYTNRYLELESQKKYKKQIAARDLWELVVEANKIKGAVYICFSDWVNQMSMQQNIGVIKSSNLCVTGDTLILTKDGMFPITECDGKQVLVPVNNDVDLKSEYHWQEAKLLDNGTKEVYEIDLIGMPSLKCTADHKVLVITKRNHDKKINTFEWKKAIELNEGDKLYTPLNEPLPDTKDVIDSETHDSEYLTLGWLIGDGVYSKGNFGAVYGAMELHAQEIVTHQLNVWKEALPALKFARVRDIVCSKPRKGSCQSISQCKPLFAFMREHFGFKEALAPNKEIPSSILNGTFKQKAAFLSGIFSADGCIMFDVKKKKPNVAYTSASYKLIVQIQMMLKEFGIHGRFRKYEHKDGRVWYNMGICGFDNLVRFRTYINFALSPVKLEKLNGFDLESMYEKLKNVEYVKVRSVTKLSEMPVYDLSLPEGHAFIANGSTIHNCSEVLLYSDAKEYGTCNLCSVSLPACVIDRHTEAELLLPEQDRRQLDHDFPVNPYFDNKKLIDIVKIATINLNNIIDKNYYPTIECERSNKRNRPIGIGLQGLADTYMKLRLPFDSVDAKRLNKLIAETMYFAALSQSTRMCNEEYQHLVKTCKSQGYVKLNAYNSHNYEDNYITYSNYKDIPKNVCAYPSMLWNGGSPISKGVFHWELYELSPSELSGLYDWETLRGHILTYGVKNSLLIALMPTASTSQFLGNNECFEPYTSNLYKRATLAGEFIMINKWLINDLYRLGLWSLNMKDYLIACEGSIQHIDGIPDEIKALYKTAWEINQEELIQQAIDRQPFVDQAQSLNWYMPQVKLDEFTKLTFKAWKGKLKTAKYYQHSKAAVAPQKFSIDPALQKEMIEKLEKEKHLRSDKFMTPKSDEQICDLCGA